MTLGVLGGPTAIGTYSPLSGMMMPSGLCAFFPYECQHWNEYDEATQSQIIAAYNNAKVQFNAQLSAYKKQGACDATVSGRLAGQLREYLLKNGGDASKVGTDESAFGPKECAEWWRVFKKAPTVADAATAVPAAWYGNTKITLSTICGSSVTVPNCPEPKPVAPVVLPPGGGGGSSSSGGGVAPYVAPKKKLSTANMVMIGGALAGVGVVGYYFAKKKGWLK